MMLINVKEYRKKYYQKLLLKILLIKFFLSIGRFTKQKIIFIY